MTTRFFAGLATTAALFSLPAIADEGHDHGEAPAASTAPALPRFAASSELFELVGVVDGRRLTVYLDRFGTNAPVRGARLDLQVAGAKVALEEHAEGEFEGELAQAPATGVTPVTATILAGDETDLLAATLDVHADEHAEDGHADGPSTMLGWAAAALAVLAAVVVAVLGARRRAVAARRLGGAA
jgi:hypothetical protein